MSRIKFGTDGWRAVISEDFTVENVRIVAQSIADYLLKIRKCVKDKRSEFYGKQFATVVGYDTRFMSEKYAEIIACVLAANGIRIMLSDRATPTPSVSLAIKTGNFIGGIMVTASHNPGQYNGIKFKAHYGGSAGTDVTEYMESRLYKSKIRSLEVEDAVAKRLLQYTDILSPHIKEIVKYADMKLLKSSKLNVMVDSMNGTGAFYIERILSKTGIKVTTMNGSRDTLFGGRSPEPNELQLKTTRDIVKKAKCDVCIVTDGDADRLGVIMPDGKMLSGHKVMTLLLLYFLEDRRMRGGVVQTICGTALIDKISEKFKLKTYETPVGFKYIGEIYNDEDILIGGEETGGVAFKGWLPERDGILSGLLILEMMAKRGKSLKSIISEINKKYGRYVYKRTDLKCTPEVKKKVLRNLKLKPLKSVLGKKVVLIKDYDGFKFIRQDGTWLMFRASGTEPKLRIYSEGHSEAEADALIARGVKYVEGTK